MQPNNEKLPLCSNLGPQLFSSAFENTFALQIFVINGVGIRGNAERYGPDCCGRRLLAIGLELIISLWHARSNKFDAKCFSLPSSIQHGQQRKHAGNLQLHCRIFTKLLETRRLAM